MFTETIVNHYGNPYVCSTIVYANMLQGFNMTTELLQTSTTVDNYGSQYTAANDLQLVDMFLHGRTANTQRKYARDLAAFFGWLDGRSYRSVSLLDLQLWSDSLSGAPKSIRERIATVRSFYAWSTQLGIVRLNPAAMLAVPVVREALHERIMTDAERDRLLSAATSTRDRVLLQFLFASGVRVSELVALRVKDLRFRDDGACVVSIYRKKTNKTTTQVYGSTSPIPAALRELVDGRRAEDAVFRSTGVPASITSRSQQNVDGPLDPSAVLRIVKAAAKRAGIDKPVSTHWLRHSCATRLCEREQNLHNVASWLGHNSINTTQRYVHVLGDLDLSHHFA